MPFTPMALVIAAGLALIYATGLIEPLDRVLFEHRLSLMTHPTSGSLVVVEIDARSIRELESWPWPRRYHAQIIDRLLTAGAEQIAIDIDFSARSDPAEDAALAAAIARAGPRLILPTFAQGASARDRTMITESAPHSDLIGPDTQVGTVNVIAEADGRIWRYAIGLDVAGSYRPSLAALLAGNGTYASQIFHVDYSIREDGLATLSFADVLAGRFDPAMVANRKVIIGATATELGDIQAVPVYRTLAGIFVQALAYETLVQGRAISRAAGGTTMIGLFALMLLVCRTRRRPSADWKRNFPVTVVIAAAILAISVVVQEAAALALDIATWLVALVAWSTADLIRTLQSQSSRLLRRHRMAVQQRRMMRAIVETSFDGIVVVDQHRLVAHANPAAARILGTPLTSLLGSKLETLFPHDTITRASDRDSQSRDGQAHALKRNDGRTVFIELVARDLAIATPQADSATATDMPMMVLTFRDVTERHNTLAALQHALTEAQSASRLKSEFLAAMGHELRTPLNAILGFSEMIRDRRLGAALDRYVDYAREIHVSGQRLSGLFETMLDFALAASGRLQLDKSRVDLRAILQRAVDTHMPDAARRNIGLTINAPIGLPPMAMADERRILEVAGHLLSNAIGFSPNGGSVTVQILERADAAGFQVRDFGIGMTPAEIEIALKPLTQVDGRLARRREGAGLGLSLAQKLVELHGGTLAIESAPGEGTSVQVWLPIAEMARIAA